MFTSRILVALAASIASSLAIAQATPPAAPAAAPKASQAPATPAAPATAPTSQRASGKASSTPGSGAAQTGGSAAGKAPTKATKGGGQRRQLQQLYASVMTEDEKTAYRNKVRDVKTYDQCKALLDETHKTMEPRAKAKGESIAQSPTEACDQAKARGRVKG